MIVIFYKESYQVAILLEADKIRAGILQGQGGSYISLETLMSCVWGERGDRGDNKRMESDELQRGDVMCLDVHREMSLELRREL